MKHEDFLSALKKGKQRSSELPGLDVLRAFCDAVKEYVGPAIDCEPIPAERVNYGQEYKVVVTYFPASYTSNLVRAYLNAKGEPYLDVYDGKGPQRCDDVEDMRKRLNEYLATPGVADSLDYFKRDAESRQH